VSPPAPSTNQTLAKKNQPEAPPKTVVSKQSETLGSIDLGEDEPVDHTNVGLKQRGDLDSKNTEIQTKIDSLEQQIAKEEAKN